MNPQLDAVVKETNENRARFEALCRSLSTEQLERVIPGDTWRTKDYIAHLASIDLYVGDWFEHQADGAPWRPRGDDGGPFNIDTWNERRIEERRDASVEDLLDEAADLRTRLWAAVDRFSPDVLAARFTFRDREISFLRYLQLWAGHDPAHTADMLRALPELGKDADMRDWLGRYGLAV